MKKRVLLSALGTTILLGACRYGPPDEAANGPEGGPPGLKPFEERAELPDAGNRQAATADQGEALFSNRCGYCHLPGGMGTNLLTVQQVKAGNPPEMGLLTNRKDLTPDYVKAVVRQGKVAMPPISRVEVTDSELDAIASYLGGNK